MRQRDTVSPLGLNMDLRWLQGGSPEAFLLPLGEVGLSILEFTLNLHAPGWAETSDLIGACRALGFELSFHLPHKGHFNPLGFAGSRRQEVEELFAPVLKYAGEMGREQGPTTVVVVHGAKGIGSREALRRDTASFLSWIEEQERSLCPALELRTCDAALTKIGDSKEDLMVIVSRWTTLQGGLCWDLGHDALNGSEPVPPGFLEQVRHVHVHDVSPVGADHFPLLFENVPYRHYLECLRQVGYAGAVVLEINGHIVTRLARETGTTSVGILREQFRKLAGVVRG